MASSSLQMTVELVQGPTQLVLKSLLGGSLLWSARPDSAYCFTYRSPYDDKIFNAASGVAVEEDRGQYLPVKQGVVLVGFVLLYFVLHSEGSRRR